MAQATQAYKRSFAGSVGSGVKSIMGGEGTKYYMLVHKVSSQYHKAGESQPIIVNQIEIGRDAKCQVRFDESFTTVSRRHAAIIRDKDNWKLVQLSHTNSTYLNGHKVQNEWYLQNGDEIQLSTNGPKLGFIIPEGKGAAVGSIGLTKRLSLFRQQALRPYKTAIWSVVAALALVCVVGGIGRVIMIEDTDCKKLKSYISRCRIFVGARTHSTIAAYSSCVPTLVIGYSVKSRGIATDIFGTDERFVLPVQTISKPQQLVDSFDYMLLHEHSVKEHLKLVMPEYIETARKNTAGL